MNKRANTHTTVKLPPDFEATLSALVRTPSTATGRSVYTKICDEEADGNAAEQEMIGSPRLLAAYLLLFPTALAACAGALTRPMCHRSSHQNG